LSKKRGAEGKMKLNLKSDIKDILKEFLKTPLGKNAIENSYTKEDTIKIKNLDSILKNSKQRYKDCWTWERV
jgi:hypothetical protein